MKCPSCGNNGVTDNSVKPGAPAGFEVRGTLGSRVVARCLQCDRGLFHRMRSNPIPDDQWETLDAFWQLRRAEILADIQVMKEFAGNPPMPEHILQSQTTLGSEKHREMKLLHSSRSPATTARMP